MLRYALLGLALCAAPATAQETDLTDKLSVELNAVQSVDGACSLTFVIINGFQQDIDRAVYETVLFDTSGQVNRLTLFDFGALPVARPRVRQFAVPQMTCESLGRVLFNGAHACEVAGLEGHLCATGLTLSSRTTVEVLG